MEELYKEEGITWADSRNFTFYLYFRLRCFDALQMRQMDHLSMFFLVSSHCCGLTSQLAIFKHTLTRQLSSFEIKTYCQVPAPWAARILRVMPTITRTPGRPKTYLTSLSLEGARDIGVRRGSNFDLPIHCPARYLYATGTGHGNMKMLTHLGNKCNRSRVNLVKR